MYRTHQPLPTYIRLDSVKLASATSSWALYSNTRSGLETEEQSTSPFQPGMYIVQSPNRKRLASRDYTKLILVVYPITQYREYIHINSMRACITCHKYMYLIVLRVGGWFWAMRKWIHPRAVNVLWHVIYIEMFVTCHSEMFVICKCLL